MQPDDADGDAGVPTDSRELEDLRTEAAFELSKRITEAQRNVSKELDQLADSAPPEKSVSELADYLLKTHQDTLDEMIAQQKREIEETRDASGQAQQQSESRIPDRVSLEKIGEEYRQTYLRPEQETEDSQLSRQPNTLTDASENAASYRDAAPNAELPLNEAFIQNAPRETAYGANDAEAAAISLGRVYEIDSSRVYEILSKNEAGSEQGNNLIDMLNELWKEIPAGKIKIAYADLQSCGQSRLKELTEQFYSQKEQAQLELTRNLDSDKLNADLRLGLVDGRLYFWTHENNPNDLINAFAQERFYLRDRADFLDLTRDVRAELGFDRNSKASLQQLSDLMSQITTARADIVHADGPYGPAMTGEQLKFSLDCLGMGLKDLEGRVSAITGINGQGRINNPRFPEGEQLGILRARLTATINSDCHIQQGGGLTYYEDKLDRIDRVEQSLRQFGDITLRRFIRDGGKQYEVVFPRPISRAFTSWGCVKGDKPIVNSGMSEVVKNGTLTEVRAYFQDLTPQDGSFTPGNGFSWARSVALDAGTKNEAYGFEPKIGKTEVDLIREHAVPHWNERGLTCLPTPVLRSLAKSEDAEVSSAARLLETSIHRNPSRLLNDEAEMARSLGVKVSTNLQDIVYSKITGRVSTCWSARVSGDYDSIRFALLCPPNDIMNNDKVNDWLSQHTDKVRKAREELTKEGFRL